MPNRTLPGKKSFILCPDGPPAKLISWIERHFSKEGISIDKRTSAFLLDYCGKSMYNLRSEIDKLCAYAKGNGISTIDKKIIDLVCCKSIEYDDFQLTNMLLEGNNALVFETLRRQKLNHEPSNMICSLW